jgi:homoserine O-acetyltransferase
LESGEVLPDITIAYQTWGELNSEKNNAILINHALTGWSDVPSWWPSLVGPGLPFDTDKYFIVCPKCYRRLPGINWTSIDCTRW